MRYASVLTALLSTIPGEEEQRGVSRVRLLHALVAQEIDLLRASGDPVAPWLLTAMEETEWAA
jgi:hypothetical protein